ncbi:MAG: NUDIX hydrolase [Ardenticatenaceae bacterium]|nr:NUDIX hydrolase [Anaerolineales bacterium]MCB8921219.1 NUDIX hydrolase [Ardenticatenaceae bacterium]MCB9004293.1 NUDIX hydrolase [Ardenticatenaceae bacterium]
MEHPTILSAGERPFAAFPVAVQAILVNEQEQILLLSSARRGRAGIWQIISGGLEASETILAGTLREVAEEVGADVQVRPLGLVHAQSFHYDTAVQHMIGTYYLMAYEGGEVIPGDDMVGSEWRWWSLDELVDAPLHASTHLWMLRRAVQLYRLWKDEGERPLQPPLSNQ